MVRELKTRLFLVKVSLPPEKKERKGWARSWAAIGEDDESAIERVRSVETAWADGEWSAELIESGYSHSTWARTPR